MRPQDGHHANLNMSSLSSLEFITSNVQHNLELAILFEVVCGRGETEGQLSCMSSRGLALWRKG